MSKATGHRLIVEAVRFPYFSDQSGMVPDGVVRSPERLLLPMLVMSLQTIEYQSKNAEPYYWGSSRRHHMCKPALLVLSMHGEASRPTMPPRKSCGHTSKNDRQLLRSLTGMRALACVAVLIVHTGVLFAVAGSVQKW